MTSDTLEDLLRYRFGVKKLSPSKRWGTRAVSVKATNAGQLTGVRLEIVADEPDQVGPLPQVGFPDKLTGQRVFFTLAELRSGALKNHPNLDLTQSLFWGQSEDVVQPLIAELASLGITYKSFEPVNPRAIAPQVGESLTAEIEFLVSPAIRRAAAKIAFNYFAYIHGTRVALWTNFDTVRHFVRFGEPPGFPLVVEDFKPILYDDTRYNRQTNGHLVTNWTATDRDIVAQVSLFNHLTYRMSLARDCQFWWPLASGHLFDVRRRRITRMGSARPV